MTALAACHAAYDAWRLTQPQLFWTDENLYGGLDAQRAGAALCVEPALAPSCDRAGSFNVEGPDALSVEGQRRGQKEAT